MLVIVSAVMLWAVVSAADMMPSTVHAMHHNEGDAFDPAIPFDGSEDEYRVPIEMENTEDQASEAEDVRTLMGADKEEEMLHNFDDSNRNRLGETLLQLRGEVPKDTAVETTSPDSLSTLPPPRRFRPVDCADLLVMGYSKSGVYEIYPFTCLCSKPVKVWCDMETDGGGWTVITTLTKEGSENFNRTWDDYRIGFGNVSQEHWIGNEVLHSISTGRQYHFRMDVSISTMEQRAGVWKIFTVGNEDQRFALTLGGYLKASSTLAHECLRPTKGRWFSTLNRDNDRSKGNCALVRGAGWWWYSCSGQFFDPAYPRSRCYTNVMVLPNSIQLKVRPSVCSSNTKTVYVNKYDCTLCQ